MGGSCYVTDEAGKTSCDYTSHAGKYYLVHFKEEKSVAVAGHEKIVGECKCGATVDVKVGKNKYPAIIEAEGKNISL